MSEKRLYWDGTYDIVLALMEAHPDVDIERIGTQELFEMTIALPEFADDPQMANEDILNAILREWYEEETETWN